MSKKIENQNKEEIILALEEQCVCPHCNSDQDGECGDYIVPKNSHNELSDTYAEDECIECYKTFSCEMIDEKRVKIKKVD